MNCSDDQECLNSTTASHINVISNSTYSIENKIISFLYGEFFLFLFILGFFGNSLNLLVLLSKQMRTRTNLLFATMAFADLAFLLLSLWPCVYIQYYTSLPTSFKDFYIRHNLIITGLSNWFSAYSIWLMLAVTIERLLVVQKPFDQYRPITIKFFVKIILICLLSLAVTFHNFLSIKTEQMSSGKFVHTRANPNLIIDIWVIIHAFTVVVIPYILSTIFNVLLIIALKKQTFPVDFTQENNNQPLMISRTKTEKKITSMVVIILTSFLVCNIPGAILFVLRTFKITPSNPHYNSLLKATSNSLANTGKVLNFILFCMSSKNFRRNLLGKLKDGVYYVRHLPNSMKGSRKRYFGGHSMTLTSMSDNNTAHPKDSINFQDSFVFSKNRKTTNSDSSCDKVLLKKGSHSSFQYHPIKINNPDHRIIPIPYDSITKALKEDHAKKETRIIARRAVSIAL